MKFDNSNHAYTAFSLYVSDFGHLSTNHGIVAGLAKWGKMTESQARAYLTPGHNPTILIKGSNDYFVSKALANFPVSIDLDAVVVTAYENTMGKGGQAQFATKSGRMIARVGVEMLRALIIGHLRVFSLDDDDRIFSKAALRAFAFENEMYGGLNVAPGANW